MEPEEHQHEEGAETGVAHGKRHHLEGDGAPGPLSPVKRTRAPPAAADPPLAALSLGDAAAAGGQPSPSAAAAAAGDGDAAAAAAAAGSAAGDGGDAEMGDAAGGSGGGKKKHPVYDDALTVFVRGLGQDVEKSDLRELFGGVVGLRGVRIARDPKDKSSRGFAYVDFESLSGVAAALNLNGSTIKGHTLHVLRSRPPRAAAATPDAHTAFVRGLGAVVGEGELRALFGDVPGGVADVRMPRDEEGRPRGFAYVEFATEEGLAAALAKDGAEVSGRHLGIAKSAPPQGGARGGRGGRGVGRGAGASGSGGGGGRGRGGGRAPLPHVSGAHGNLGHQRRALQLANTGPKVPGLVPRALVTATVQHGTHGAGTAAPPPPPADGKPHSNMDFKRMLLGGGGPMAAE